MRYHCPAPNDNYPYAADTFALVKRLAPLIKRYSKEYNVPPVAVAGAIADEYNTRAFPRSIVDWFQDEVLLNWMPNSFIRLDAAVGLHTKLLNSTRHDIGTGNIKLSTARRLYSHNRQSFAKKSMDWSDLVDYLRTDEGTVHIAALVIKRAKRLLSPYVQGYPQAMVEAVYVTFYKQGRSYLTRFLANQGGRRRINPGEGCRTYLQRNQIVKALGLP